MCDAGPALATGWRGWQPLPASEPLCPAGPWVDLSHPLHPGMPRIHFFPPPRFDRILALPRDRLNVTEMQMVVHTGTHVDSPRHFFADAPALEEVPVERLTGPGVVWPVAARAFGTIEPADLAGLDAVLRPGDILGLCAGWSRHAGQERYDQHPCLGVATAEWLVARRVKLVALDVPTPDLAVARRGPGFDYPVHRVLLSRGVLIAEHVTGLGALAGRRVEFVCGALGIVGGDGSPARILARPVA